MSGNLQAPISSREGLPVEGFRHFLLTDCIGQALALNPTMTKPNIPSPLSMNPPRVHRESAPSYAQSISSQKTTPGKSGNETSRIGSAAVLPQQKLLSVVDEEDTMITDDKLTEATLEKSSSSVFEQKQSSAASYHGKRDPFANEDGRGIQYKTMAWWYVRLLEDFCAVWNTPNL